MNFVFSYSIYSMIFALIRFRSSNTLKIAQYSCYFIMAPYLLKLWLSYPLWQLQFYSCSSTTIPGSIIYNFLISSPKYYNVTLSAHIRPYSFTYCTLSRDGALHQQFTSEGPMNCFGELPNKFTSEVCPTYLHRRVSHN